MGGDVPVNRAHVIGHPVSPALVIGHVAGVLSGMCAHVTGHVGRVSSGTWGRCQ